MQTIPLSEHPSNLDPTARIVAADRHLHWTVYSVRGGFVLALEGMRATPGLFSSDREAAEAASAFLKS